MMPYNCFAGSLGRLSRERLASVIGNIVDILSRDAAVLKRLSFEFPIANVFYNCPEQECKHLVLMCVCRYEPNLRDAGLWKEETSTPVFPVSDGANDKGS